MTTCWSQEKFDSSNLADRKAVRNLRVQPEALLPVPNPQIDPSLASRVEEEPLLTAGHTRWRAGFIGGTVMVAAMVGTVILVCNDVASLGVLGSVATVAGIVAAVGVGRFVLWGRIGICVPTKAVD
jgi:hypothetical protein